MFYKKLLTGKFVSREIRRLGIVSENSSEVLKRYGEGTHQKIRRKEYIHIYLQPIHMLDKLILGLRLNRQKFQFHPTN